MATREMMHRGDGSPEGKPIDVHIPEVHEQGYSLRRADIGISENVNIHEGSICRGHDSFLDVPWWISKEKEEKKCYYEKEK